MSAWMFADVWEMIAVAVPDGSLTTGLNGPIETVPLSGWSAIFTTALLVALRTIPALPVIAPSVAVTDSVPSTNASSSTVTTRGAY